MTLSILLSAEAEELLRRKATAVGQDLDEYAARILERAATTVNVDDALAPFRRQVEASGMSDEQLDDFLADVRQRAFDDFCSRDGVLPLPLYPGGEGRGEGPSVECRGAHRTASKWERTRS